MNSNYIKLYIIYMIVFDQVLEYMINILQSSPTHAKNAARLCPCQPHLWQCYEVQLALLRLDPSVHEMPNTGSILSHRVYCKTMRDPPWAIYQSGKENHNDIIMTSVIISQKMHKPWKAVLTDASEFELRQHLSHCQMLPVQRCMAVQPVQAIKPQALASRPHDHQHIEQTSDDVCHVLVNQKAKASHQSPWPDNPRMKKLDENG